MRWRTLANVLLAGSVIAEQKPLESAHGDDSVEEHVFRKTIIDVLSADKDYTLLLQAVQRARLVPTLNRLNGSTLFAPTNAAIERYAESHPDSAWASLLESTPTNPHNELRQHVFYHLLNYTATPTTSKDLPAAPATYTHKTLHFPQAPEDRSGPPSHEPPNLPPWMPLPGGLLAGEPQRVRVTWRDDAAWVAVSEQGKNGVKVVKNDVEASNGRVVGIDDVISLPKNLADVIRHHPSLKTLSQYITPTIERTLTNTPHLTLFVPDDKAWDVLKPMEKLWLDSGYAEQDLMDIFARHATTGEKPHEESGFADDVRVGWSEYWGSESSFQSLTDSKLQLTTHSNGTTMVNDGIATVLQKDVYASNGVLHTLDSLLVPSGSPLFQATAEKWLLALNASVFVGMLREAGLDSYVNGTGKNKEWTILAPADDVLSDILQRRDLGLFGGIKEELRKLLRYHIIPGIIKPEDLLDGQLLGTELRPDSLKGNRMRLKVDVVSGKKGGDPKTRGQGGAGNGDLAFGGANVIAEPVRVDNTIIYLLSRPLSLPPDAMKAALDSLEHTTFTSLLFSSGLNVSHPATTLLVPVNEAFAARGLATKWLMMDDIEAQTGLKRVLMHHIIEGVVVGKDLWFEADANMATLDEGGNGNGKKKSWGTVEGSDVRVLKEGDSVLIEASGPDESPIPLTVLNTLTLTGALHEVSGVLWPRSVRVGIRELGLAADASTMLRLVQRAGFEGIWNGTGIPVESVVNVYPSLTPSAKWSNGWFGGSGSGGSKKPPAPKWTYTLLCPTDAAFARINLTRLLDDHEALVALVRQHIVPIPLAERDSGVGAKDSTSVSWADWFLSRFIQPERGIENLLNGEYAQASPRVRLHSNVVSTGATVPLEPDAETPLPLQSSTARFGTLQTSHSTYGDIVFAHTGDRGWAVTVKGAEEWAGVKAWGKTVGVTPGAASVYAGESPLTGGVVQIDRVLEPYSPSWWREWVPALGVGAAGVASIGMLFWGVVWVWKRDVQEATYEPTNGDEDE
ncbi:carnitine/acyl carnitine carrier protein, putative [Rhizoctonia solani AG-3 Rhs1AP]|uniref:Carnitine/acyl carnitine carrier protein, putative n=1 Tax=Rhizoctonia solani AG-3 Rhs1AP TaxID=1086054 RepID=X8JJY3_9AGAM|nr:carnitine/acyl carnitine carrier protein, putative [Rhizoctonia solani AG-3 Rhs1AP]